MKSLLDVKDITIFEMFTKIYLDLRVILYDFPIHLVEMCISYMKICIRDNNVM